MDPIYNRLIYHSDMKIVTTSIQTMEQFELQYLEDQTQAVLFQNEIDDFSKIEELDTMQTINIDDFTYWMNEYN